MSNCCGCLFDRKEVFNFNDTDAQETFKSLTSGNLLSNCFLSSSSTEVAAKKWFKEFNNILHRSFKKVRITGRNDKRSDVNELMMEKNKIVKKLEEFKKSIEEDVPSAEMYTSLFDEEDNLENVNGRIADLTAQKNAEMINLHFKNLSCEEGGFSLPKMYGLKKKLFPKDGNCPTAMIDLKGNLVSNKESLIKLHEIVYEDRLEYKDIRPEWKDIKDLQNKLFQFRSEVSSLVESPDWAVNQVEFFLQKAKEWNSQ